MSTADWSLVNGSDCNVHNITLCPDNGYIPKIMWDLVLLQTLHIGQRLWEAVTKCELIFASGPRTDHGMFKMEMVNPLRSIDVLTKFHGHWYV